MGLRHDVKIHFPILARGDLHPPWDSLGTFIAAIVKVLIGNHGHV
jgi:hypothetical protein